MRGPDYTEALALADTVCVLLDGEVRQIAKAQELYDEPVDRDVARFVGNPPINIVPGRLTRMNGDASVAIGDAHLKLPKEMEHGLPSNISEVEIGVRPEHVKMVGTGSAESHLSGTVNDLEPLGMHTTVGVNVGGANLFFTVPGVQEFKDGDKIEMQLDIESILFFDPQTGRRVSS